MIASCDDHDAVKLGWVFAYVEQVISQGETVSANDAVAHLMMLKGEEEHQWIKTSMDFAAYAVRIGYSDEQFQECIEKAKGEGIELTAEWLIRELYHMFSGENDCNQLPCAVRLRRSSSSSTGRENNLRPIIIDGCNVGLAYDTKKSFACQGLRLCVDFFKNRGHSVIKIVLPGYMREEKKMSKGRVITNHEILSSLQRYIFWTPSGEISGQRIVCYDDRYIIKLAKELDGIIVSNDGYRDLIDEDENIRTFVEERLLMFTFFEKRFIVPSFPLGLKGSSFGNLCSDYPVESNPCPYGLRCTYGNTCKFSHMDAISCA